MIKTYQCEAKDCEVRFAMDDEDAGKADFLTCPVCGEDANAVEEIDS
ncbi:MAG: hypothetical protein O2884_09420 [Chloroflexi bacterium]|nr:hypothetical protein [Chloroflexota bacterium]